MSLLENKRILFFAPKFFGYENLIKQEMERQGAIVHMYDERPNPTSVEKVLIRKARFLIKAKIKRYYAGINDLEKSFHPNYVLFVNSEAIDEESLDILKQTHTKACFILYMWDSTKNKRIKQYFGKFDKLYSFDQYDCEKYGMSFRPLFFAPIFGKKSENVLLRADEDNKKYKYDVSFIGTVHSDRVMIVMKLMDYCNRYNLSYYWYLYVPGKLMYFLRWCTDKAFRQIDKKYVSITPMPQEKIAEISDCTRCVLDINHPKQTGLTMRTIEMLGVCKKIITTNKEVKNYDFYVPTNQIVISRDKIDVEMESVRKKYVDIEPQIYEKYTLSGWIRDIFQSE